MFLGVRWFGRFPCPKKLPFLLRFSVGLCPRRFPVFFSSLVPSLAPLPSEEQKRKRILGGSTTIVCPSRSDGGLLFRPGLPLSAARPLLLFRPTNHPLVVRRCGGDPSALVGFICRRRIPDLRGSIFFHVLPLRVRSSEEEEEFLLAFCLPGPRS